MLRGYLFVFLVQLRWFTLGLADATPTVVCFRTPSVCSYLTIQTIPFVADAPDYFKGYGGKIVGAVGFLVYMVTYS